MAKIPIRGEYDLDLTMFPSFTSSLFTKLSKDYWVKTYGAFKGLKLKVRNSFLESNINNIEVVNLLSGLWYEPNRYLNELSRSVRYKVEYVVDVYEKIRIAINPYDKELMFLATALSQRTNYHANVIKWVKHIASLVDRGLSIKSINLMDLGRSYQLKRANVIIKHCINIVEKDKALSVDDVKKFKKVLLTCKFVGPKVVNAYLMFTRKAPYIVPVDIHFIRFLKNLNLLEFKRKPVKNFCAKYICDECPYRYECVEALAMKVFKNLSSWIQTVAYVHDKLYCSRNKCSSCPLRSLCVKTK
ncbi:MAG: hypothetical protein DRN04_19885 [Thermoprotei archaeon]|nr:MAG: hypothetical protein DRN04_19885 [Thermoprotei archaeon]